MKPGSFRIYHPWYQRHIIADDPENLYVFGDNVARKGSGPKSGQAVIRGLPNALGVRVKYKPSNDPSAFFNDTSKCWEITHGDLMNITLCLEEGRNVYWPADGIGTGRAKLKNYAPRLAAFIDEYVEILRKSYP